MTLTLSENTTPCPICEGKGTVPARPRSLPRECAGCGGSGRIRQVSTDTEEPGA